MKKKWVHSMICIIQQSTSNVEIGLLSFLFLFVFFLRHTIDHDQLANDRSRLKMPLNINMTALIHMAGDI